MNEKELQEFYGLLPEGMLSLEEVKLIIETEGIGALYGDVPECAFTSVEEMQSFFPSLKKKTHPTLRSFLQRKVRNHLLHPFRKSLLRRFPLLQNQLKLQA